MTFWASNGIGVVDAVTIEERIRGTFEHTAADLAGSSPFLDLVDGRLSRDAMREFLRHLFLPHYQSAHILAFEYALLASDASDLIRENMLEEMGHAGEEAHPGLLLKLLRGVGFSETEIDELVEASQEQARAFCAQQLPFATLRDVGLAILIESAAFEHFLSRHAAHIGAALEEHYGVPQHALAWFALHGELDVRHAEEAVTVIREYATFHRITDEDLTRVIRAVFAVNPLAKRYFPSASSRRDGPAAASRIEAITIYRLRIPFRAAFRHAQFERAASDAIVVRVRDRDGNVGYGETLPREYVTGEDAASVVAAVRSELAGWIFGLELGSPDDAWERVAAYGLERVYGEGGSGERPACTAAYCAVELALLDWAYRRNGESIARRLPPVRREVVYSGVVSAEEPEAAAELARRFADADIGQIKLKVGVGDDVDRVRAVRRAVGDAVLLRLDANGAWDVTSALANLAALASFGIESVEQPVSHLRSDHVAALREVRERAGLRIVVDESLITLSDARALVEARACDVFNVRVSKNGGLAGALAVAQVAYAAGVSVQVGAQVGETAILTAAGRHLAAHLPELASTEGSFGTLLLSEDVGEQDLRFGLGGVAPVLEGPGLGVDVRQDVIERLAIETIEITR